MPDDPRESSFMLTAEVQLKRLQALVGTLEKRSHRQRRGQVIQGVLILVLVVVCGVLGRVVIAQHQSSVQSCQAGNTFKAADAQHWALFIQIALKGNTKPEAHAAAQLLLDGIDKSDQPRNCGS